jgi:cation diffusion facilitator family transporter
MAEELTSPSVRKDAKTKADRRTLATALVANVVMFLVGLVGWRVAHSAALLADSLDMLADASGYAIAFLAVGRSERLQRAAARWNGTMLMALGVGVFVEVAHRWSGSEEPHGGWIMLFACLSLLVNGFVLYTLRRYRASPEVHLRATWVDTRADVLVNVGVLVSGALVAASGYRMIDLLAGTILAVFVIHEGWELWEGEEDEGASRR